jgi:tetratricopeptide (TPR) repeat protein
MPGGTGMREALILDRPCRVYTWATLRAVGLRVLICTGTWMNLARHILLLTLFSMLSPCLAWSQSSFPSRDPIFRAARKAQLEGRIADAEKILNDGIHALEQTQPKSPDLVPYLNLLASIYGMKQQTPEAHAIFERVLEIDRSAFGAGDGRSLRDLINVATTLGPGKNDEAEQLLKQALDLALQNPTPDQVWVLGAMAQLAQLYQNEQRWYDAEPLAEKGLEICGPGPYLPGPCETFQRTLETVYRNEGRSVEAGQVAASGSNADLPPELDALNKTARRNEDAGLYVEAEFNYRQAAAWIEAHPMWTGGAMPTDVTGMLPMEYDGIARALEKQGRVELAEEFYMKSIEWKEARAAENPMSVSSFNFSGLMNLYRTEGRLSKLEPIMQHALSLQEKAIGESSKNVAQTLVTYASLLTSEGK